jgi:fructose-1,6-bisphosphatase I
MVTEIHRILVSGGIWASSANEALRAKGHDGVMRMLYEVNPMAFIVEQAGGLAYSGSGRVLEVNINELHQRGGAVIGSRDDVELYLEEYC